MSTENTKPIRIIMMALSIGTVLFTGCTAAENEPVTTVEEPVTESVQPDLSEESLSEPAEAGEPTGDDSLMYQYSSTIETEKPELDEVTKELVSAYHKNPTQENYDALRAQVEIDYDKVLEKKNAKLEELKQTAKEESKIQEMQDIVDEMIQDRDNRINQTMRRLTDSRLRPGSATSGDGYYPVMGAGENIYISYTEVTNADYAVFIEKTGAAVPSSWSQGELPSGKENHPVTGVSCADALAYCKWLSETDHAHTYRLPSEEEWELAAGHMPKDAAMNTANKNGTSEVTAYAETVAACGAIDMWGNVWEWTSTKRTDGSNAVKGGAWTSAKTECRTENRNEAREVSGLYPDVGFRVIRETKPS